MARNRVCPASVRIIRDVSCERYSFYIEGLGSGVGVETNVILQVWEVRED